MIKFAKRAAEVVGWVVIVWSAIVIIYVPVHDGIEGVYGVRTLLEMAVQGVYGLLGYLILRLAIRK